MLGLFNKKKIHLSRADFVVSMMSLQQKIVVILLRAAQQNFQPNPDAKTLQLECEVLSLWILSLAIQDNDIKDIIYAEYCRHRNFDDDAIKQFCGYLNMRYEQYYDAFHSWAKDRNGAGGAVLGSVIANGIKGGESDKLEFDIFQMTNALNIFIENFISTLEFVRDLKKKYDLSEIKPVFVNK